MMKVHRHFWIRGDWLIPEDVFEVICKDVEEVLKAIAGDGVLLAAPSGIGGPIIDSKVIAFNGVVEESCEVFMLDREDPKLDSCNTGRQPYDIAVMAALIVLKKHLRSTFRVFPAGTEEDWMPAKSICSYVLGYGGDFCFKNGFAGRELQGP